MKKIKKDIEKFKKLMQEFGVDIKSNIDEYNCTEITFGHYNKPLFYFDENGKFICIET